VATIELALVLPMLLLLVLSIFDIARAIQANMILVSIGREGANMASRSSGYTYGQIMDSLAATTPPLDMGQRGMIYITRLMGRTEAGVVRNVVLEQHRWQNGWLQSHFVPTSRVWNCGSRGTSWSSDGSCAGLPGLGSNSPTANVMTGQLTDGAVVYAVETYYLYQPLLGPLAVGAGLLSAQIDPDLYALTLF
jgi:hypothetical protein